MITGMRLINFLKDNPGYVATRDNKIVQCILGTIYEYTRVSEIKKFNFQKEDEVLINWTIMKPTSFMDALRAWSCGSRIARKSNDNTDLVIYEYKGRNLDDIEFDGCHVINNQWFIVYDDNLSI